MLNASIDNLFKGYNAALISYGRALTGKSKTTNSILDSAILKLLK